LAASFSRDHAKSIGRNKRAHLSDGRMMFSRVTAHRVRGRIRDDAECPEQVYFRRTSVVCCGTGEEELSAASASLSRTFAYLRLGTSRSAWRRRDCRRGCAHHGHSGNRARNQSRPPDCRMRHQSRRNGRGVAGQGTDRSLGGGHLSGARDRASGLLRRGAGFRRRGSCPELTIGCRIGLIRQPIVLSSRTKKLARR
jgi:hypothetical protein